MWKWEEYGDYKVSKAIWVIEHVGKGICSNALRTHCSKRKCKKGERRKCLSLSLPPKISHLSICINVVFTDFLKFLMIEMRSESYSIPDTVPFCLNLLFLLGIFIYIYMSSMK